MFSPYPGVVPDEGEVETTARAAATSCRSKDRQETLVVGHVLSLGNVQYQGSGVWHWRGEPLSLQAPLGTLV